MYKVGIIGNSIDDFTNHESVKQKVKDTVDLLSFQYGQDLIIEMVSNTGVGDWVANYCLKNGIKYNLSLPFPTEFFKDMWYKSQSDDLNEWLQHSSSIFIASSKPNKDSFINAYKHLVDDCNFVVYLWSGKKQGLTFSAIKYSLEQNKLSLDAFNELKLITKYDLKK